MEVVRYNQVDISKLNYHKPVNQQNVYFGAINYNDIPCYIQSPKVTFVGVEDDKTTKQKNMIVSVDVDDFSFYDFLVKLDDHNLSETYKNSKEWFKKELPMDILEGMYRRITKPFKKDEIPTIKLKIPVIKQKIQCSIYDQTNSSIELDTIKKGSIIIGIFHMKGLKFLKKDYYCDIYISQLKLCQSISYSIPQKCLIEDETINNSKYDYEIIDEEVILSCKKKIELEEKYLILSNKIEEDKKNLELLRKNIDDLN